MLQSFSLWVFLLGGEFHNWAPYQSKRCNIMDHLSIPIPNPSVISQEIFSGEAVLVNLDNAASLALNPSGLVVWQFVDGQRSVAKILAAVRSYYQDVPDTMEAEVTTLLNTLEEGGFIGFEWEPEIK